MNKPYAQPVYRAAGGAICETEEEARDESRQHYLLMYMQKELYPSRDTFKSYCEEDRAEILAIQLLFRDGGPILTVYKEACEYADARLKEEHE